MKAPVLVGCAGFPEAQARYFSEFPAVEVNATFYQPPRPATLERWRSAAPKDFRFTLKAWQVITHPAGSPTYRRMTKALARSRLAQCGHFQASDQVREGWAATQAAAAALKASVILFQTPTSFYPNPDLLRAMYDFFKRVDRDRFQLAWEPRGDAWKPPLVRQICDDLGLIRAGDPLREGAFEGRLRYYRLHGAYRDRHIVYDHRYSDEELARLAGLCRGPAYVFFNNASMGEDARRFRAIVEGA